MTRNSLFFLVGASSLSHFVSLRSFLFFSQFTECRLFKRLFLRTFVSDSFLLPARQGQHPHSSNRRIVCNRKSVEIDFVNLIFVVSFDSAFPLCLRRSPFSCFLCCTKACSSLLLISTARAFYLASVNAKICLEWSSAYLALPCFACRSRKRKLTDICAI